MLGKLSRYRRSSKHLVLLLRCQQTNYERTTGTTTTIQKRFKSREPRRSGKTGYESC